MLANLLGAFRLTRYQIQFWQNVIICTIFRPNFHTRSYATISYEIRLIGLYSTSRGAWIQNCGDSPRVGVNTEGGSGDGLSEIGLLGPTESLAAPKQQFRSKVSLEVRTSYHMGSTGEGSTQWEGQGGHQMWGWEGVTLDVRSVGRLWPVM